MGHGPGGPAEMSAHFSAVSVLGVAGGKPRCGTRVWDCPDTPDCLLGEVATQEHLDCWAVLTNVSA